MNEQEEKIKNPCSVCGEELQDIGPSQTPPYTGRTYKCMYLEEAWHVEAAKDISKQHIKLYLQRRRKGSDAFYFKPEEAKRNPQNLRYDILDPEFEDLMAKIADYGAKKYGELNWHISRLEGDKSPINHIRKHLNKYRLKQPYDHSEIGLDPKIHLVAIAFNAMMEFYYESDKFRGRNQKTEDGTKPYLDGY